MKPPSRKTKILATLGPASNTAAVIEELLQAGADGFRLNFSHGTHDSFRALFPLIRNIAKKSGKPAAILQDLQGPKIRVGLLAEGKPVHVVAGQTFTLTVREIT